MAERLAALGLRVPSKAGAETPQQRQDRERKEKEDRLRQAEVEDAKREEERQKRLEEEQIVPPVGAAAKGVGKAPPPPPTRHKRAESLQKKADAIVAEEVIKEAQEASKRETESLEYVHPFFTLLVLHLCITC